MNALEKKLVARLLALREPEFQQITPGVVIDVYLRGRRQACVNFGRTYDFYDLASLTKIIFTASASVVHFSKRPGLLRAPIKEILPWWSSKHTTPFDLLSHSAGLDWWMPIYKKMRGPLDPVTRFAQFLEQLKKVKPNLRRKQAVYSDLDIWMMGAYLQEATGLSLLELWEQTQDQLQIKGLNFHPGNRPLYKRSRYAPTEKCEWRGKVLQGEVHDENAWSLAGVAPHAGLFGGIDEVSSWGLSVRKGLKGEGPFASQEKMLKRFTKRQLPRTVGDWGLGFMKPSKGRASCGRYFHGSSYGHTGFTGTSLWMDPTQDLLVVILSNRVHPTRNNSRFVQLRPQIHDWICELISP